MGKTKPNYERDAALPKETELQTGPRPSIVPFRTSVHLLWRKNWQKPPAEASVWLEESEVKPPSRR